MLARIEKATAIDPNSIVESIEDGDLIVYEVQGSQEKYLVSCNHDKLWRCSCDDFHHHGLNNIEGAFVCKHIIAVILFIAKKGVNNG